MKTYPQNKIACVLMLAAVSVVAQPPAVQQQQNTTKIQQQQQRILQYETGQTAPELYPGESEDIGPQRLLKLKPRHEWFEGLVDSQFFYTSNGRLSENPEETTILV